MKRILMLLTALIFLVLCGCNENEVSTINEATLKTFDESSQTSAVKPEEDTINTTTEICTCSPETTLPETRTLAEETYLNTDYSFFDPVNKSVHRFNECVTEFNRIPQYFNYTQKDNKNFQYPDKFVGAYCFKTSDYYDGYDYPIINVFQNEKDVSTFIDNNKNKINYFSNSTPESLLNIFGYDDSFFDEYFIVNAIIEEPSGSNSYFIQDYLCIVDDELIIALGKNEPDIGTDDMAQWQVYLAIPNEYKSIINFKNINLPINKLSPLETLPAAKPVIYLYPEEKTDVNVKLDFNGKLLSTFPKYENGWDVVAYPDGKIINKKDGSEYSYLFWDGYFNAKYDFSSGFVVKGEDTADFLREKLSYMGSTPKEYNEFIVYWLPLMEHNNYNLISFQSNAYTDNAKLSITPTPDSMLRIFMAFKPLDKYEKIKEQKLSQFDRKGFTVIEWGGALIKN